MIGRDGRRFRLVFNILAVASALALILAGWALYDRFQQTNQFRAAQAHVWHAVICSIEVAVVKSPHLPEAKKRQSLRFYDRLLVQDVNAPPCGLAQKGHRP